MFDKHIGIYYNTKYSGSGKSGALPLFLVYTAKKHKKPLPIL